MSTKKCFHYSNFRFFWSIWSPSAMKQIMIKTKSNMFLFILLCHRLFVIPIRMVAKLLVRFLCLWNFSKYSAELYSTTDFERNGVDLRIFKTITLVFWVYWALFTECRIAVTKNDLSKSSKVQYFRFYLLLILPFPSLNAFLYNKEYHNRESWPCQLQ